MVKTSPPRLRRSTTEPDASSKNNNGGDLDLLSLAPSSAGVSVGGASSSSLQKQQQQQSKARRRRRRTKSEDDAYYDDLAFDSAAPITASSLRRMGLCLLLGAALFVWDLKHLMGYIEQLEQPSSTSTMVSKMVDVHSAAANNRQHYNMRGADGKDGSRPLAAGALLSLEENNNNNNNNKPIADNYKNEKGHHV